MKVSVSLELNHNQRIAVGLLETGTLVPASREEVRSYVTEVAMASINVATAIVVTRQEETSNIIRESLGMEGLNDK